MMRPVSSISPGSRATPAIRTVILLPEVDTYVDPASPAKSFAGQQLVVSADQNGARKIAYARFDLSPVPPTATVTACQFYFTVAQQVTKQVVKLRLVDNDTWAENITFDTAPQPAATAIGTWEAESEPRVTTPAENPVLVGEVQKKLGAGRDRKLSLQISSTFGREGGFTSNSYYSFETAGAAGKYASGPRLVVQYEPAVRPLARDWGQGQADARHSGRSPWMFANTPTRAYLPDTVCSGVQLSSPVVIRNELLYLFTPTELTTLDPAGGPLKPLVSGLAEFGTLAMGPNGWLYAAAKSGELAAFDLTAGGKKIISLHLANLSSAITAGADGSVYLTQGSTLFNYVQRLGALAPAWCKELGTDVTSQVTLSADGLVAYVATANQLYALHTADGSEQWSFSLPAQATQLATPVAGGANGLSYFAVDETLYVFKDIGTPVSDHLAVQGLISQPVIDANDVLHVLQGTELYTVSQDGTSKPSSVTIPGITAADPVKPVMDGSGNLFIIDNECKLFVYMPGLKPGNNPQPLPFAFGSSQPSLQVAPNGSLFSQSGSALFRLKPSVESLVTVSSYADATSYRAASSLMLAGAALPAAGSVVFQSGGTISMEPGFSVPLGTEVVFNTGY